MLPIVLIHGFPFDATMWRAQVDFLRGLGREVLAPDLPGFGTRIAEAPAKERGSIEGYAAEVHEVIQGKAGGRAIVGGFSMGGYVLLALLRDYPEDVAAAMLIDTRADADSAEARGTRQKAIEQIQGGMAGEFLDGMIGKVLGRRPSPIVKTTAREIMDRQAATGGAGMVAAQSAMMRRRDQTDLLGELKLPTLVVVGAEDQITPPSVALNMQSHMPHAMVVQIVSAGHLTVMEQPGAVNGAIETFLQTVKGLAEG